MLESARASGALGPDIDSSFSGSASKLAAEAAVLGTGNMDGMEALVARPFPHTGPGQDTRLTTFHIYQEALNQFDMGAAAAQTLVYAFMVGLITLPFTMAHDAAERRLS